MCSWKGLVVLSTAVAPMRLPYHWPAQQHRCVQAADKPKPSEPEILRTAVLPTCTGAGGLGAREVLPLCLSNALCEESPTWLPVRRAVLLLAHSLACANIESGTTSGTPGTESLPTLTVV